MINSLNSSSTKLLAIKNTKEVYFIVIRFLFKNLVNISFFKNLVIIFKNLVNKCLLKNLVNLAVLPDFCFTSCLDFFEKSDLIFCILWQWNEESEEDSLDFH